MKLLKMVIGIIVVLGLAFFALKEMTSKPIAPITPEPGTPSTPVSTVPSGWETLMNGPVSIAYPSTFAPHQALEPYYFLFQDYVSLYTDQATYRASNYRQEGRFIISKAESDEQKCFVAPDPAGKQIFAGEESINGLKWKSLHYTDAGAGNRYEVTLYRTLVGTACYEIATSIHYASDWTGIDMIAQEASVQQMRDVLKSVVATVTLK